MKFASLALGERCADEERSRLPWVVLEASLSCLEGVLHAGVLLTWSLGRCVKELDTASDAHS